MKDKIKIVAGIESMEDVTKKLGALDRNNPLAQATNKVYKHKPPIVVERKR